MRHLLGWTYRDIITGFTGVATAGISYLTGCDQVSLQPLPQADKPNDLPEGKWFDVTRCERVEDVPRRVPRGFVDDTGKASTSAPAERPGFDANVTRPTRT